MTENVGKTKQKQNMQNCSKKRRKIKERRGYGEPVVYNY